MFTTKDGNGYLCGRFEKIQLLAHRVSWALYYGEWPSNQIDHINGIRDDNRIENLRDVSHQQNGRNQKRHSTNTSGVCGVRWDSCRSKWRARIRIGSYHKHLGYYDTIEDAEKARKNAEVLAGFSERHGTR
jgi:hypothetical protein